MRLPTMQLAARIVAGLAVLVVFKVTASVLIGYRHYLPPNFESDFLLGREAYFWGLYAWAFYTHLVAGPATLVLGTILISSRFRAMFPTWHRRLGRIQGLSVLVLLVPSGLVMAVYAMGGWPTGLGLAALAVATACCMLLGWKAAVQQRMADHRQWMLRTYALLLSAVVIRIFGGLAAVAAIDAVWVYRASVWSSWIVPLMAIEFAPLFAVTLRSPLPKRNRLSKTSAAPQHTRLPSAANQASIG